MWCSRLCYCQSCCHLRCRTKTKPFLLREAGWGVVAGGPWGRRSGQCHCQRPESHFLRRRRGRRRKEKRVMKELFLERPPPHFSKLDRALFLLPLAPLVANVLSPPLAQAQDPLKAILPCSGHWGTELCVFLRHQEQFCQFNGSAKPPLPQRTEAQGRLGISREPTTPGTGSILRT